MRKYYIFIIRQEFYENYKNNPLYLYKTLEKLYSLKISDFGYGISIYNQLCLIFNTEVLNNYFLRKFNNYKYNKHFIKSEHTIIEINKTCIVLLTKYNIPKVMKNLLYCNKNLFVCDFENRDYFWLQEQYI